MFALRYSAILILIAALGLGFFVYKTESGRFAFKLGLDLSGGTQLVYSADTSKLSSENIGDSLSALQSVIERRINAFGVGEPAIEVQQGGALGAGEYRLTIELPGVTDIDEAIKRIGQTPLLEFKLVNKGFEGKYLDANGVLDPGAFADTGLTGAYLRDAQIQFGNGGGLATQPVVKIDFNSEGTKLFGQITSANVGRELGIFLDGALLSAPVIQTKIDDGTAIVSGNFTAVEAKELATNLSLGALPVPIHLSSSQTIGAALGNDAKHAILNAGIMGFIVLALFMLFWYRLPGLVAVVSLSIYVVLMLVIFKLIPVVLTAAGMAGFILSIGLAIDANVLIAERIKEELRAGKNSKDAIREGFTRAWTAIRDSNIAHVIAAVILFWVGTSIIRGFALVFGLGVFISMLSAVVISRTFLLSLGVKAESGVGRFLMRSGLN